MKKNNLVQIAIAITVLGLPFIFSCSKDSESTDVALDTIRTSLIAYYPFNGDSVDKSGQGNNCTIHGATLTTDHLNRNNKAYQFVRSNNDYINTDLLLQQDSTSQNFTVCGWFLWDGTNVCHAMGTYNSSGFGWYLKLLDNEFVFGHGGNLIYSELNITTNTWYHVALSFDGQQVSMFINGEHTASISTGYSISSSNLIIGAIPKYLTNYNWNGKIDNIRVYTRALSGYEILQLYQLKD